MRTIDERLDFILGQIRTFKDTVYVAFSGGKDSSAVVKLIYNALLRSDQVPCRFCIVYVDTGVENPVIDRYVKKTLQALKSEAAKANIPLDCKVIEPAIDNSFFVRLIGRGYPPPTNSFRWCTKDIRIRPIKNFLKDQSGEVLVIIGSRFGESQQRDRSMRKAMSANSESDAFYQKQRDGFPNAKLFTPIIDFSVSDVWDTLATLEYPEAISAEILGQLYQEGSGECPTIRDFKDKPCSKARFGCWTCTVVRRDRSAERMIQQGHEELIPYFEFRRLLTEIRNDPKYRCRYRRNGRGGPGPFNLEARQLILQKLNQLEVDTGEEILNAKQRSRIQELWDQDINSEQYSGLE
jgi:DNA sulfur modification protein DndC